MKIKRIEHIAIACHDMKETMGVFENAFGLKMECEEDLPSAKLSMYPVGETYIEFLEGKTEEFGIKKWVREKGQSLFHICFEVEDIDGALDELRAKGVKLLDETPKPGHGGSRIAFIDPESTGNVLIELAELPPGH
jgi:methylmalonyl-CoA/ethylmalonyl-CoA epimerase